MFIKYFFSGFFVTIISGFDDTLTNVPVLATVTKTKKGKLFFSLGWLCSLFVNLVIVLIFSELLNVFSYTEYIVSGLIFLLAVVIYFDFLSFNKGKEKIKKKDIKIKKEQVSVKKLIKLAGFGFVIAFITSIDDMIAFLPLFIKGIEIKIYSFLGILVATIAHIVFVFYFAGLISKIKYKKRISVAGLILLGVLILTGIL